MVSPLYMNEKLIILPLLQNASRRNKLVFSSHGYSDKRQRAVEETAAVQQRKFLEFLSAFDKVQKSTNPRLVSKNTGLQGN